MRIQELARMVQADVDPDVDFEISGAATIADAGPADVTFLANPRYTAALRTSRAGAALVERSFSEEVPPALLRVDNPYLSFALLLETLHRPPEVTHGVHATAVLGEGVVLGDDVCIGPYVVIGDGVRVGDGVVIHPHVVVYEGAVIGPGSVLHSFAVVREHVRLGAGVILQNGAVVGADGFGFAPEKDRSWHKIPQTGGVELGDAVEIQANACVDRATVGATTIGRGTKIDNLVQVGHGCHIGEDTLLCGQTGLAGSTEIGNRTVLAGQVGVPGHCRIGDDVVLVAQSGAAGGIQKPGMYGGTPAVDLKSYRQWVVLRTRLPDLFRRVKEIEKRLGAGSPQG